MANQGLTTEEIETLQALFEVNPRFGAKKQRGRDVGNDPSVRNLSLNSYSVESFGSTGAMYLFFQEFPSRHCQ